MNLRCTYVTRLSIRHYPLPKKTQRFFYQQLEKPLPYAYDLADFTMSNNMVERDTEEGIAAFVEKRKPDWDL